MIAVWINIISAIVIVIGIIGVKLTDKYIDGKGIYNSALWFVIGMLGFCVSFWTTIITIAYKLILLNIGG